MKIQLNKIVMNRTRKYLAPILKGYGEEFAEKIHSVFKLAYGIGDIILIGNKIQLNKHIFILIDTNVGKAKFEAFQLWIRQQPMYEDDYAYDDIVKGHLHMLIIKFPDKYIKLYETFTKGKYSKLYTNEEIESYFESKDTIKVLIRDRNYMLEFINDVNSKFKSDMKLKDVDDDFELDYPPVQREEVFTPKFY